MTPAEFRPLRPLLAAAVLALLALAGCGGGRPDPGSGYAPPASVFFGWGSGWGGNRDWGGGPGEGGMGAH